MKFKKLLAGFLILGALTSALFAKPKKSNKDSGKLKVVTTIFPEYDWTRQILGEKLQDTELTLLMANGVDLHSYQPAIQDIAKISTADIFIYVGGESDKWVKDALKNANNKNMKTINLMETLGSRAKVEELKEGMQAEAEEEDEDDDHDHEAEDEHEHHHHHDQEELEYDEHVWLSLKNAKIFCTQIAAALCEKDSKNAALYQANLAKYIEEIDSLDVEYSNVVRKASKNTLLFADRFPFRYLVDDYNLDYYAAFIGCSAETEASFETIIFLANKLNELNLKNICQIESGNGKIANTIIKASKKNDTKILVLDSLQSTNQKDIKNGTTYLSTMLKNLKVLKEALE